MIEQIARCPTLILAPNKTLAAQLYGEMKALFPDNAVEYFVSYYDYYQPEAYVPRNDLYIEKEKSTINEQIDGMRHSATRALLERDDVIIVASGILYLWHRVGGNLFDHDHAPVIEDEIERQSLLQSYPNCNIGGNDLNFSRGTFRVRGDNVEIFPAHLEDRAWRISLFGDEIEDMWEFDPLTGEKTGVSWTKLPYLPIPTMSPRARPCNRRSS